MRHLHWLAAFVGFVLGTLFGPGLVSFVRGRFA